jgi:hypothetical protein
MNTAILEEIQTMSSSFNRISVPKPTRRAAVASLLALPLVAFAGDSPAQDDELLKVREKVWRDWFAGNREALMSVLPPDFFGIGSGGGTGHDRTETVAASEAFAASGSKLANLGFTDNRFQRLGNVVVIYCGYTRTITDKAGVSNTVSGRATEVFVRTGAIWQHPGWHLDSGR